MSQTSQTKPIDLIVALDSKNGFAKDGSIPWHFSEDLKFFAKTTKNTIDPRLVNAVIMGRKTWEEIPDKFRPLPNRLNIVISRTLKNEIDIIEKTAWGPYFFTTIDDALQFCNQSKNIQTVFMIGGLSIYEHAMASRNLRHIYLTRIKSSYDCDRIFNLDSMIDRYYNVVAHKLSTLMSIEFVKENGEVVYEKPVDLDFIKYTVTSAKPENPGETQYLNLLSKILDQDKDGRDTRNAPTYSIFGNHLTFDLRNGFPLLTTKKMFWRGIVEELLFFLKGDTNSNHLSEKLVRIWEGNTTREFLDSRGLTSYEVGDMGPMYGWNWRHFGADYKGMNHDYTGQGFDQLRNVIQLIKTNPTSRRIMMTALDPSKVCESVLAPCHSIILQFYVSDDYLDLTMYQRSADSFLGVPYNITSNALLLSLIAKVTGLKPRRLMIVFGDTHIYKGHEQAVRTQISREPKKFPSMEILKPFDHISSDADDMISYLENLTFKDFKLSGYKSHPKISAPMYA